MDKPLKYNNPDERRNAWIKLHSSPEFTEFFLKWVIPTKIEELEKLIVESVPPDKLLEVRRARKELQTLANESSTDNFTPQK
jgi:hypothetical protein